MFGLFHQHSVLKVHPCCSKCQNVLLFQVYSIVCLYHILKLKKTYNPKGICFQWWNAGIVHGQWGWVREMTFSLHSELECRAGDWGIGVLSWSCCRMLDKTISFLMPSFFLRRDQSNRAACSYPTRGMRMVTECVEILEGKQGVEFALHHGANEFPFESLCSKTFGSFTRAKSMKTRGLLRAPSAGQ